MWKMWMCLATGSLNIINDEAFVPASAARPEPLPVGRRCLCVTLAPPRIQFREFRRQRDELGVGDAASPSWWERGHRKRRRLPKRQFVFFGTFFATAYFLPQQPQQSFLRRRRQRRLWCRRTIRFFPSYTIILFIVYSFKLLFSAISQKSITLLNLPVCLQVEWVDMHCLWLHDSIATR